MVFSTMIHIDPKMFPKADGAFLVGGSIRDMLCGRSPVDYDVAVLGDPFEFARLIATRTKGRLVEIGKPGQMIIRVVSDSAIVDIAQAKDASIQKDLMARDFTINAMAYDLSARQLVDPMGARHDLNDRIIRMVAADIFKRDPVRLLRAYRIATQFGFEIESKPKRPSQKMHPSSVNRLESAFAMNYLKYFNVPDPTPIFARWLRPAVQEPRPAQARAREDDNRNSDPDEEIPGANPNAPSARAHPRMHPPRG